MGIETTFALDDVSEEPAAATVTNNDPLAEINTWVDKQVESKPARRILPNSRAVYFDIETGPRPEAELRRLFHEKTLAEFSETCDKRWKPETVAGKYEEYKVSAWQEFVDKAALSPITGRVLLLGILRDDQYTPMGDANEADILSVFWPNVEVILADKIPLIGHNSNAFDIPFLVRRSWLLGVPVPREIHQGRYWHPLFRDTMEYWNCGARDYVKLNAIADFFGVGQKTAGVKGGDFHRLWFGTLEGAGTPAEQRTKALEYNETDLRLTAAIAAKMGMA